MAIMLNRTIPNNLRQYRDPASARYVVMGDSQTVMDRNSLALYTNSGHGQLLPNPSFDAPYHPFQVSQRVRAMVLNVTSACPLRCVYCFRDDAPVNKLPAMALTMAQTAVDSAFGPAMLEGPKLTLGFFGGEPLLCFPLLRDVVAYAKKQYGPRISFSVTSNGVMITEEIAAFLRAHAFQIIISIDGPPDLHNEQRPFASGKGSYEMVVAGLTLLKGYPRVTLRATYTKHAPKLMERVRALNQLCNAGLGANVSVEPECYTEDSCDAGAHRDQLFTMDNVLRLTNEYMTVAKWMCGEILEGRRPRFHNIEIYIRRLLHRQPWNTACGAGVGYVTVDAAGTVYACHRMGSTAIGDLPSGGINPSKQAPWIDNRAICRPKCNACDLLNICGGPCRQRLSSDNALGVDPVHCAFYRLWVEAAAYVVSHVDLARLLEVYPSANPRTEPTTASNKPPVMAREATMAPARVTTAPSGAGPVLALVREAGGIGDIISMGGAAAQIKHSIPNAMVVLCVPTDFVDVASHLVGVDDVIPLGPLGGGNRRLRNEPIPAGTVERIQKKYNRAEIYSLWCPAHIAERDATVPLAHTRAQIFAWSIMPSITADHATPRWQCSPEERAWAQKLHNDTTDKRLIGLAPRATGVSRSLPVRVEEELVTRLRPHGCIVILDTVKREQYTGVLQPVAPFKYIAAIVERCSLVVTVDTCFAHLAPALGVPTLGIQTITNMAPMAESYPLFFVTCGPRCEVRGPCPCNFSPHMGWSEQCEQDCAMRHDLDAAHIMNDVKHILEHISTDPLVSLAKGL